MARVVRSPDVDADPLSPREAELLAVTLELLQEHGYDRLTLDAVATTARASKATLYRRWPTKAELVLAAFIEGTRQDAVDPDTGTLRGDLLALGSRSALTSAAMPALSGRCWSKCPAARSSTRSCRNSSSTSAKRSWHTSSRGPWTAARSKPPPSPRISGRVAGLPHLSLGTGRPGTVSTASSASSTTALIPSLTRHNAERKGL